MPAREIADLAALQVLTGQEVAVTEWMEMTQERINTFAAATDDYQWIHVDVERCKRESPFGTTIAHGYLTLSLISQFSYKAVALREPLGMTINYGSNRVRFISPVRCGARIRSRHLLMGLERVKDGWQAVWQVTIEIEGQEKPACVAETIARYYV